MSNSYKPKNSKYIDSTGIVHNRQGLNEVLDTLKANMGRIESADFNDLTSYGTGLYNIRSGSGNTPDGMTSSNSHWYVMQIVYSSNFVMQMAYKILGSSSDSQILYIRKSVSGTWTSWYKKKLTIGWEDKMSECSNAENYVNAHIYTDGDIVSIVYQGESKTHSGGTKLFDLPAGYAPASNLFIPFSKNVGAYGQVQVNSSGSVTVNAISDTSLSGRIYFECTYPIMS